MNNLSVEIAHKCTKSIQIIWRGKSKLKLCHNVAKLLFATIAGANILLLIGYLLAARTTIVTTGEFYNEKKMLTLPGLLLCFSKVFTYNKLRPSNLVRLYQVRPNLSSATTTPNNAWKLQIEDVILGVRFNDVIIPTRSFLKPVFYLPSQSCWQTVDKVLQVRRAGQLTTLDLIANAGVHDDLILNYTSPLTYLTIIPFVPSKAGKSLVFDSRNSIHISPGRFSAVGFSWTKVDSTHRSKHDQRSCTSRADSNAHCISSYYRSQLAEQCSIQDAGITDPLQFYKCGLQIETEPSTCSFEPCVYDVFKFGKSEGYIKFDKRLSALALPGNTTVNVLKQNVVRAFRLHSQFNPDVRESFGYIAQGMGALTSSIATSLMEPKGFQCGRLLKLKAKLNHVKWDKFPNVIAEREYTSKLSRRFVRFSLGTFRKIGQILITFGGNQPKFHYLTPNVLPVNLENTQSPWTTPEVIKSTEGFGDEVLNKIVSAFRQLYEHAIKIIENYKSLQFSKFIQKYSPEARLVEYWQHVESAIDAVKNVKKQLFEKQSKHKLPFAHHRAEDVAVTYPRHASRVILSHHIPTVDYRLPYEYFANTSYQNDAWLKYVWHMNKGRIRHNRDGLFDAIHGHWSKTLHIPILVELFCRFYNSYLSIAEIFHGTRPAFDVELTNSRFEDIHEYVTFVMNALFDEHETSYLLSIENGGLPGAERRSCARMAGYTVYMTGNATFEKTLKQHYISDDANDGGGQSKHMMSGFPIRTQLLIRMVADYQISLQKYQSLSVSFDHYYDHRIAQMFGELVSRVWKLRSAFIQFHKFNVKKQQFKRFLVDRLKTLSRLLRHAMNGGSEENISHFLSKKGKILIGEIHFEMMEIQKKLSQQSKDYKYYRKILRDVVLDRHNRSMESAIIQAVLNAGFHSNTTLQNQILQTMQNCNHQRWSAANAQMATNYENMVRWLRNATLLLTRAKRYTSSVQISRDFLRKNIMHVSLYYNSLTVLTETSKPLWTQKLFWTKVGSVTRVYLRITTFRLLDMVTSFLYYIYGTVLSQ